MSKTAPTVRVDREWMEDVERYVCEQLLFRMADMINAMTKAGAIYGTVPLPPDLAAAKKRSMEQQQEQV